MPTPVLVAIIFIVIGCFFIYVALAQYNKRVFLMDNGMPADGIVIRLEQDSDPDSHIWYPVIRFTTLNQEIITIRHNFGTQPASYHVGQQVQILYDPSVPKEFVIGANGIAWEAYIFGFIGVVVLSGGLYTCFVTYF